MSNGVTILFCFVGGPMGPYRTANAADETLGKQGASAWVLGPRFVPLQCFAYETGKSNRSALVCPEQILPFQVKCFTCCDPVTQLGAEWHDYPVATNVRRIVVVVLLAAHRTVQRPQYAASPLACYTRAYC